MDEADRLLDKIDSDFAQDLDTIFEALPKETQNYLTKLKNLGQLD